MIVPELPADIAELKRQVGRFVEEEVYPVEQRVVERNALDPAELAALRVKAGGPAPNPARAAVARTMTAFNCYACHVRDKVGGVEEALNAFFAVLARYTIADLVAARPNVRHLLGIDMLERRVPAA